MKIILYTTWGCKCGIAVYSAFFKEALESFRVGIKVVPVPLKRNIVSLINSARLIKDADLAHIQYEYSFFGKNLLLGLVSYCFFIRSIKIPKVVTMHEVASCRVNSIWHGRIREFVLFCLHRLIYSKVSLILVHLNSHKEALVRMGISPEKIAVILHPIPRAPAYIKEAPAGLNRFRRNNDITLTIFGFIVPRKGYGLALDVMGELAGYTLLIAGSPPPDGNSGYLGSLVSQIKARGIGQKVFITGYISAEVITELMDATDIILAPFTSMSGSGSISMAASYGKVILGSDIAPFRELKDNGFGIELFRLNDARDLKEKITALARDKVKRQALRVKTELYAEKYSYKNTAEKITRMYEGLL